MLIIMMVIAPSFQSIDNNIKMPQINSGLAIEEGNTTVSITKNGEFYLDSKKINCANLENLLTQTVDKSEKKELTVRADKQTKSSEIMKVMRAAQNAGYEKLIVAGEPLSKQEQKELKEKNQSEES